MLEAGISGYHIGSMRAANWKGRDSAYWLIIVGYYDGKTDGLETGWTGRPGGMERVTRMVGQAGQIEGVSQRNGCLIRRPQMCDSAAGSGRDIVSRRFQFDVIELKAPAQKCV